MPAVSVLHSPRDEALGEKIADALSRQGVETRCLSEDPLSGDLMLEDGAAAIVIWSNATAKLARLHAQAREALERGALIPVTVGGAQAPSGFETLQPVDLSGWGGDENDPRWRFVLEEVTLASQRLRLQDGGVWAPEPEAPEEIEGPAAQDADHPQDTAREEAMPSEPAPVDEDDSLDWEIDPPETYAEEPFAAEPIPGEEPVPADPINVEASYAVSAEHYWPEQPAQTRKPIRFNTRHVVVGGGFALFALTTAAIMLAPAMLSSTEAPSIAFVQPADENAASPDARADAPKTQSDFEVTSYREPEDAQAAETSETAPEESTVAAIEVEPLPAEEEPASTVDDGPSEAEPDPMEALVAEAIAETAPAENNNAEEDGAEAMGDADIGDYFRDCALCPDMARVPAGAVLLGSPASEATRQDTEGPQTHVVFTAPFAISAHEVTFEEWQACVDGGGCNAYTPSDIGWGRGRRPVVTVSYEDAQGYAAWLSAETGFDYRLPSEAEWEYAARAGAAAAFSFGRTITTDDANFNGNYPYFGDKGEYRRRTTPVASFAPNAFGLYDMHGNVWEWTADCWAPDHANAPADGAPVTTSACTARVIKGGAWNSGGWRLRAAHRLPKPAGARENDIGFRVVRSVN